MLEDYHVHSNFCDGKDDLETIVKSAVEKKMDILGILHHSYVPFDPECRIELDEIDEFKREIDFLQEKYRGQITLKKGVEMDYYGEESLEGFDYSIGSVHYFHIDSKYIPLDFSAEIQRETVDKYFDGDFYKFTGLYFDMVSEIVDRTKCTIIGHFDLICKFNEKNDLFDEKDERYVAQYRKCIDKLVGYGIPFELNTGAISRGYKTTPYPNEDMIEYIKSKGGKLILSSDAHSARNLCYKFDEYAHLI